MSEIAGRLAPQAGAHFLEKPKGGRGILLGGVAGVAPGRVVVIGGGMVGYNAAIIAIGLGAQVTILERSVDRMRYLEQILSGRVTLLMSSSLQIEESIKDADLVIGAVLIPGALAPKLITREMLGGMKEASVLVDVAIDQGGCAETSRPTTHDDPIYTVDGIIHYCVANMPGAVPITSTRALTNVTLPYVEALADYGIVDAIQRDPEIARGVNVLGGRITYEAVAEAHGLEYTPLDDALGATVVLAGLCARSESARADSDRAKIPEAVPFAARGCPLFRQAKTALRRRSLHDRDRSWSWRRSSSQRPECWRYAVARPMRPRANHERSGRDSGRLQVFRATRIRIADSGLRQGTPRRRRAWPCGRAARRLPRRRSFPACRACRPSSGSARSGRS